MYRDYEGNAPIQFYEYDNRIEIQNPGGLYGKVSPDNFPNISDYRNPFILEAMKVLGYVNRFSRGVYRVHKELKENGNAQASFDFSLITAFRVVESVSQKYFEEGFGVETLKKQPITTQEKILAAIHSKPEITQKELAQFIGITLNGIKCHIKNMTKLGIIKHEGSTKSGKWIIVK
ncbi:ATP-binding protein [Capnocytophaga sp. oral taxon 878]|uniref:ATP-binding protein n=1 Tax=Capnocytophaga sp. oral taxon 878 TaxID=1316596 RepID=UPI0020C3C718|nr:ATP-binding protein [Capnocytophaga sp. oral taxon 878]